MFDHLLSCYCRTLTVNRCVQVFSRVDRIWKQQKTNVEAIKKLAKMKNLISNSNFWSNLIKFYLRIDKMWTLWDGGAVGTICSRNKKPIRQMPWRYHLWSLSFLVFSFFVLKGKNFCVFRTRILEWQHYSNFRGF